jgi:tetratricopeptide (TPR) repeat protein
MMSRRVNVAIPLLTCSALVLVVASAWLMWRRVDVDAELQRARNAFRANDYASAMAIAETVLAAFPRHPAALVIAGGAAAAQRQPEVAWSFYQHLPVPKSAELSQAACVAAHLRFFDLHHANDAEQLYKSVLEFDRRNLAANSGYANLLGLTGRRWEAIGPTLELIQQGQCSVNQLILIGSEAGGHEDLELLTRCSQAASDDAIAALGVAWQYHHLARHAEAMTWVDRALAADGQFIAAHVLKGTLLLATSAPTEAIRQWHAALPAIAEAHPELWLVRGQLAQRQGFDTAAIRCYWETLRRNPNYRTALFQLAQLLNRRNEDARAQPFLKRIAALQRLKDAEALLFEGVQESTRPIQVVAERMEALGRFWEAVAWSQQAQQIEPQARWPVAMIRRLQPRLRSELPLTAPEFNPAEQVDLSTFAWDPEAIVGEPKRDDSSATSPSATSPSSATSAASSSAAAMAFRDDALSSGLTFRYFNAANPDEPGQRMYEFSGGGVAAIDYDQDGWCDLYFTQGCPWPPGSSSLQGIEHLDRLYRNSGAGQWIDVTLSCQLREVDFSQGVTAGDYDNDGFPDLYVSNIGRNRLFRNQGDGTFADVTPMLPLDPMRWSTSAAMADLNGDAWPDLYVANYLEAPDVFDRICQHKDGVPRMCAPFDFPGSQDQFLLNLGDGRFEDATASAGFQVPDGKGLGVLVADFEQSGRLSVFVANDLVANFYFANQMTERGAAPHFEEQGLINGLAFNGQGQAQGCMGIAGDDLNGDQRIDLLVTNFYMEPNVLYLQEEHGSFRDATAEAGLVQPSLPVLGFGVQTVDANLDGIRDVIVTNGHVDDHRAYGQPYTMPPQFFLGLPGGRFAEQSPAQLGPFFEQAWLGRGMARLDWNRDGREDVAISHLESPAALVTNHSEQVGQALGIELRGVRCDRDAVGARVVVTTSQGIQTRQITAGDGYQASNQRQLIFGLGPATTAASVEVRWPTGDRQSFLQVDAGSCWLVVQGVDSLTKLYSMSP